VGGVTVEVGSGSSPFGLPGTAHLTGPYKGAPYGLAFVVPAKAGPIDLGMVREVARAIHAAGTRAGQPFVGTSAFAHKGGMHVHAVAKATESYEHIHPEAVGNERRILVSELSGRSNIQAMVTRPDVRNDRALLDKVLAEVCRLENEGWQFEAAGASFDLLVDRCAGTFLPPFEKLSYNVAVESRGRAGAAAATGDGAVTTDEIRTEATVKLVVAGSIRHEVAEGDGPVNALDAALRKALLSVHPSVERMTLLDYKVRVINAQEGTAAKVRVSIESTDGDSVWGTVGVSENVIEASWLALADSFSFFLSRAGA
jgi:2-isopropylmalate synthase